IDQQPVLRLQLPHVQAVRDRLTIVVLPFERGARRVVRGGYVRIDHPPRLAAMCGRRLGIDRAGNQVAPVALRRILHALQIDRTGEPVERTAQSFQPYHSESAAVAVDLIARLQLRFAKFTRGWTAVVQRAQHALPRRGAGCRLHAGQLGFDTRRAGSGGGNRHYLWLLRNLRHGDGAGCEGGMSGRVAGRGDPDGAAACGAGAAPERLGAAATGLDTGRGAVSAFTIFGSGLVCGFVLAAIFDAVSGFASVTGLGAGASTRTSTFS